MVLSELSVPGCPTYLDNYRTRAVALAVGAAGGCLDIFFSCLAFIFSFSLSGRRSNID